jgi:hypothetical protein
MRFIPANSITMSQGASMPVLGVVCDTGKTHRFRS